jgi:GT2 family glycosyltransferase
LNQARWLSDNLHSVAVQTYPDIEHIVMDGGSTDGSIELLQAAGDNVVWRSEPDAGQADALNQAFALSTGEIIGWINSDDAYFDERVVEDVVAYFDRHPEVDVAYGHALQTAADGHAIQVLWAPSFDADLLKALDFIPQPAAFIRRSALAEPMLDVDFHFGMDYELWLRLHNEGRRFGRVSRILAIDRHQPERKSLTTKDVYRANLALLEARYEMHLSSEWERQRTTFYVRQRLAGALLIPRVAPDRVAFTAPHGMKSGLLQRQLLSRKSTWPEEYR